jgi:hypothetical protein
VLVLVLPVVLAVVVLGTTRTGMVPVEAVVQSVTVAQVVVVTAAVAVVWARVSGFAL